MLLMQLAVAQQPADSIRFNKTVKWAPASLTLGSISLNSEYNLNRNSLTFRLGIPVGSWHHIEVFENSTRFRMRSFSLMAGYRRYLGAKPMRGVYVEPFLQYVLHRSDGTGNGNLGGQNVALTYNNRFSGAGVGAQFGVQFIVKRRIVLDLFLLGPVMNYATDKFFVQETGDNIPWTNSEAEDAARRINDFTDNFPFLRNNTEVEVNAGNRTVQTRFKGLLPGLRTGLSVGILF